MGKSPYKIQFGGLPIGIHEYEFEIKEAFFKDIENSEIEKANIVVNAILTKQNNLLTVNFEINGTVGIACDRCLADFDFEIESTESLVIKHGNPNESTDEILVIPEGIDEFDLKHYLYEYITLAVPIRKVPCEVDDVLYKCDKETLKRLNEVSTDVEKNEDVELTNPMWEQLNKIKYNKN
ncbi:MAG: DUF177 domain-containing protein [Bacteroidetes bacterium]|nr:DUF177 domain-containing protein [Bacteroidota bacterium]